MYRHLNCCHDGGAFRLKMCSFVRGSPADKTADVVDQGVFSGSGQQQGHGALVSHVLLKGQHTLVF